MKLEAMSMKALLTEHNRLADKPAGAKTFKTKGDLLKRVFKLTIAKGLKPSGLRQLKSGASCELASDTKTKVVERHSVSEKSKGHGVGLLARRILRDPSGTPYEDIAMFINEFIPGAKATARSISWYASKMRKEGHFVPQRAPLGSVCVWIDDPATANQWLADCGVKKHGA